MTVERDEALKQLAERFNALATTTFADRLRDAYFKTLENTMLTVKKRNSQYANKPISNSIDLQYSSCYAGKKKGLIIVLKPVSVGLDFAFAEVPYGDFSKAFKQTGGFTVVSDMIEALEDIMAHDTEERKLQAEQSRREYEENPDYGSW